MRLPFTTKKRKGPPPKRPGLDEHLDRMLIRRVRDDPGLALKMALKRHKFEEFEEEEQDPLEAAEKRKLAELLETDPDFAEQVKKKYLNKAGVAELEGYITEEAIRTLQANPGLMAKAVQQRISGLLAPSHGPENGIGQLLEYYHSMKELQDEMGGGHKGVSGLITPEVIITFLEALPSLLGNASAHSPPKTYTVETPIGTKELAGGQNQQLHKSLPAPVVRRVSPKASLNITEWVTYLDKDPQEFVDRLMTAAAGGDPEAKFALSILSSKTSDELLQMLAPYKDRADVGDAIRKLGEKQDWLTRVIAIVQLVQQPGQQSSAPTEGEE